MLDFASVYGDTSGGTYPFYASVSSKVAHLFFAEALNPNGAPDNG